jgi:hypothetical protein
MTTAEQDLVERVTELEHKVILERASTEVIYAELTRRMGIDKAAGKTYAESFGRAIEKSTEGIDGEARTRVLDRCQRMWEAA